MKRNRVVLVQASHTRIAAKGSFTCGTTEICGSCGISPPGDEYQDGTLGGEPGPIPDSPGSGVARELDDEVAGPASGWVELIDDPLILSLPLTPDTVSSPGRG
jgi:hypothetical protein